MVFHYVSKLASLFWVTGVSPVIILSLPPSLKIGRSVDNEFNISQGMPYFYFEAIHISEKSISQETWVLA